MPKRQQQAVLASERRQWRWLALFVLIQLAVLIALLYRDRQREIGHQVAMLQKTAEIVARHVAVQVDAAKVALENVREDMLAAPHADVHQAIIDKQKSLTRVMPALTWIATIDADGMVRSTNAASLQGKSVGSMAFFKGGQPG